jgi:hypothetical protein
MYTQPDFKSKKALKEAVAAGKQVEVYDPAGLRQPPQDGIAHVEGPHYPKPHTWYGRVELKAGLVVKVL